jgi:hypothetical protein
MPMTILHQARARKGEDMGRTTKGRAKQSRKLVMTSFMVTPNLLVKLKIAAAKRGQSLGALMQSLRSGGPR